MSALANIHPNSTPQPSRLKQQQTTDADEEPSPRVAAPRPTPQASAAHAPVSSTKKTKTRVVESRFRQIPKPTPNQAERPTSRQTVSSREILYGKKEVKAVRTSRQTISSRESLYGKAEIKAASRRTISSRQSLYGKKEVQGAASRQTPRPTPGKNATVESASHREIGWTVQSLSQGLQLEQSKLLQWKYMNARLETTAHQEQHLADSQLSGLTTRALQLRNDCHEAEMMLSQKQHITQLHANITQQHLALSPIAEVLSEFSSHYEELFLDIERSAHRMAISGVSVDQDAIAQALGRSREVLDSIVAMIRDKTERVESAASTFQSLDAVVKRARSELVSSKALLREQKALEIEERSLIAHCAQVCNELRR
eukprot:TRINITY_DN26959_c0_g1_i1.p1 TRINITY_DN26959_c0_g1~~TRINITY_DN26959_c0_g1_i1.p1  ORF type:complete len:370 (+),score=79.83 TRINITY_DN26959_c0_g1_i1:40-1149(+)